MIFDEWSPVTSDMGLVEIDAEAAAAEYVAWQRSIGERCDLQRCDSFSSSLERLPPLSMEKRRALFVPTASAWTAFFQSGIAGSDPCPAMSTLAKRLGVRAMRVCCSSPHATWPATIWEVYAPQDQGGIPPLLGRRSVAASNDGGRWTFHQSGEPFPFEQIERYALRHERDRFDRELLVKYLAEFGLLPFDDAFYAAGETNPALLVERATRWSEAPPEYTLAEVLAGVPWNRGRPRT